MLAEYSADAGPDIKVSKTSPPESLPSRSSLVTVFALMVIAASYFGWNIRDEFLLSAEYGLGYALGIVGGVMMLLLLIYPLRKRFYHTSVFIFSTKSWFKLHMILGILGPLLILFHCNFSFGSINSNVALASMLLMMTSGLIGRYIYSKIHYGLYGKKIQLKELKSNLLLVKKQLDDDLSDKSVVISEGLIKRLHSFDEFVADRRGLIGSLLRVPGLGLTTRMNYWLLVWRLKKDQQHNQRFIQQTRLERQRCLNPIRDHMANYLSTVRKIAGLNFYERLFSLWHMLHLPIFFMLIITGFVHVYAVHAY